jgi:GNAT superfamily N-acetyltransferase
MSVTNVDDPLSEADRNMVQVWEHITGFGPQPGRTEHDGLLLLSSGVPFGLFNPAFAVDDVADPERAVDDVQRHYASIGMPFAFLFRDEAAPGLSAACERAGLTEHWRMPLMVLDPIPTEAAAPPPGLDIVVVDGSTIEAYGEVLASAFGMPPELVSAVLGPDLLGVAGFTGFLGLMGGAPVATSALYRSEDTAGVYNVGTVAAARGKGIGAALTWAAAHAGREAGAARSILQASEMGEPVYTRMGYATPARYRQFEQAPTTPS